MAVDPDIRIARTPSSRIYRDPTRHARLIEQVLIRSWQLAPDPPTASRTAVPFDLLPGSVDEPLVLTWDDGALRALSNVCTHRGAVMVTEPCRVRRLRCPYHGRRFGLDGRVASAPGFDDLPDFPGPADHLPSVEVGRFGPWAMVSLDPHVPLEVLVGPLRERLGFFLDGDLVPDGGRDYTFDSNWQPWVENYLEGFHIPYVHPGLTDALDTTAYRTEIFDWCNLQIGVAADGVPCFDLPPGHPDHGQRIAGYYAWLFPNTMINVYPWGVSLNLVYPLGPDRTRVCYRFFTADPALRAGSAGDDLHGVELEDQAVVALAHRGLRSRLYQGGRYAPAHERCVHHFHRLLDGLLPE